MNVMEAVDTVRHRFASAGNTVKIPNRLGEVFTATLVDGGVQVDNLVPPSGPSSFIPWAAFQEAVCILIRNGGRAKRGDAMRARLGDPDLPLDSVEGHVAHVVYGHPLGRAVFRRIVPVDGILVWAGICEVAPNELILRDID